VNLFPLTRIFPFVRRFLQHIEALGLPIAMANAFEDCNIRLVTRGETTGWNTTGKGVLFVGNHSSGFEQVPLMAMLGGFKRSDLSVIAIPGIGGARTFELLDREHGSSYTLPVLPALLAKDRKDIWNRFFLYRVLHYKSLPARAELRAENIRTLSQSARLLEQGYAIILFPTGRRDADICGPWQRGLGEVVNRLSEAARANVMIVPFLLESDYSKYKLAKAFVVRSLGRLPKQRTFTFRLGHQGSCLELLGKESDPSAITETVRMQYRESLF
jgi:1-acyl-sn-glycerol-3-phosphate acyltransferase